MIEEQQPLTGYRVLDLSGPMGVYCGKLMADMGADVIKAEPPGGDPMRRNGPFANGQVDTEQSLYWLHFNTNKRSITLDITSAGGAALLRRLADGCDVLLETFQPGYMDSHGLGWDVLSKNNPRLIYASLTPFGQTPGMVAGLSPIGDLLPGMEQRPLLDQSLYVRGKIAAQDETVVVPLVHQVPGHAIACWPTNNCGTVAIT